MFLGKTLGQIENLKFRRVDCYSNISLEQKQVREVQNVRQTYLKLTERKRKLYTQGKVTEQTNNSL